MPGNMTMPKFTETGNWITDILERFNYLKNLKYFYSLVTTGNLGLSNADVS